MKAFAAIATVCALSLLGNGILAWRLSCANKEVVNLQLTATKLRAALDADRLAHDLRAKLYNEAHDNAQANYDAINGVSDDLPDADWLDGLRGWMRPQGGNNSPDTAGISDAGNATSGTAGGTHADK